MPKISLTTDNVDFLKVELESKIETLKGLEKLSHKQQEELVEAEKMLKDLNENPTYTKEYDGKEVTTNKEEPTTPETKKQARHLFRDNKAYKKLLATRNKLNHITPVDELLNNDSKTIARIEDLELGFVSATNSTFINKVIRKASIEVQEGEILALIGESGSGKTVISSTLYGLAGESSRIMGGKIYIYGQEVQDFTQKDWEKSKYRGRIVSGVFQNPQITLNPTKTIKAQMIEGILLNGRANDKKEAYQIAKDFLIRTRIHNVDIVLESYPHELSGGMKQRVVIASIIACGPRLIVMDEPTTALDPSVQAEIIEIVRELSIRYNIAIIFITHDLGVVASIADRIAIMYSGQVVEEGTATEILYNPRHPYTWGLLQSMPDLNRGERLKTIRGSVPGNLNNIVGEAFAPRNDYAIGMDFIEESPYFKISETHKVKSWLYDSRTEQFDYPAAIATRMNDFSDMRQDEIKYSLEKAGLQKLLVSQTQIINSKKIKKHPKK